VEPAALVDLIRTVVGQPLWSAIAGPQDDYVLALDLGARVRRSMRLANRDLSFVQRTYEGEYALLVECPWRVDGPERVLVSCYGLLGRKDPPISDRIGELEDRVVESVALAAPGWDLVLGLSGGVALRCFAAEVNARGKRNNWAFWGPGGAVTIGPGSRILEPRPDPGPPSPFARLAALGDVDERDDWG